MAAFFIIITWQSLYVGMGKGPKYNIFILPLIIILLVLPTIVYIFLARKNR